MQNNTKKINDFQFDTEFCDFINNELLAYPQSLEFKSKQAFWDQFTHLLSAAPVQPITSTEAGEESSRDISLANPRYALKAINARWGSLYSALYHENAIPHCAGLKTDGRYNVARASRVVAYSREFLDSAFPLKEGSHKDAVSYLIYFQNLMVTLADGSTVGLQKPAHFVAKSGPKSDPDSIIMRNDNVHVEIRFNRNGVHGSADIANIDDILVEAPARTVLSCQAQTASEKCEILRNLNLLMRGELKVVFQRDGKQRTRRVNKAATFTARDNQSYTTAGCNPVVLRMQASTSCAAVRDAHGQPLPDAVVDAALLSLLTTTTTGIDVSVMACSNVAHEMTSAVLNRVQSSSNHNRAYIELIRDFRELPPESHQIADTLPQQMPWIRIEEEQLKDTVTIPPQNTAVLRAINTHSVASH